MPELSDAEVEEGIVAITEAGGHFEICRAGDGYWVTCEVPDCFCESFWHVNPRAAETYALRRAVASPLSEKPSALRRQPHATA